MIASRMTAPITALMIAAMKPPTRTNPRRGSSQRTMAFFWLR
jgi:hypothetical protein